MRRRMLGTLMAALASLLLGAASAEAASPTFPYEDAVDFCRGNVTRPTALNEDRSILCYDGLVLSSKDFLPIKELKEHGLFVIRSKGGYTDTALYAAFLLRKKNPTVVAYDYCFSACAHYFLIATDRA